MNVFWIQELILKTKQQIGKKQREASLNSKFIGSCKEVQPGLK